MLSDYVSVIMSTVDPLQQRTRTSLKHLAESTVPYELILISRNRDWSTGSYVNQGIAAALGEYVLFCDDDCFVEPETLEAMHDALKDSSVGVAGALLLYPDGTVQHAGGEIHCEPTPLDPQSVHLSVQHIAHHQPAQDFPSCDVDFVTGALMMTRRDVLDRVGWYDAECELDWGDVDFCLRVRKAGYRVRFVGEAHAVHLESATRNKRQGNVNWFFARWHGDMIANRLRVEPQALVEGMIR